MCRACGFRPLRNWDSPSSRWLRRCSWRGSKVGAFGCYGLPAANAFGKLFWVGALWGMCSLTVLMLALRAAHVFYFGAVALHGVRMLKFAVFWAVFFLIVGFYEEFFTRGYTQFTLTEGVGFWPAAILLSLGFGALHLENPGEDWVGILAAMLIGFFFCLTLRRTGNLWFAIGFHAAWDWGESYLYSVPDSGGRLPATCCTLRCRARAG